MKGIGYLAIFPGLFRKNDLTLPRRVVRFDSSRRRDNASPPATENETTAMQRTIDTTVKIDATDTRVHIGVTVMPMTFDTVRFTPLTETGRKILRMGYSEYRISTNLERGYGLYDQLGSAGYTVEEECIGHPEESCKWDKTDDAYLAFLLDSNDYSGCA